MNSQKSCLVLQYYLLEVARNEESCIQVETTTVSQVAHCKSTRGMCHAGYRRNVAAPGLLSLVRASNQGEAKVDSLLHQPGQGQSRCRSVIRHTREQRKHPMNVLQRGGVQYPAPL